MNKHLQSTLILPTYKQWQLFKPTRPNNAASDFALHRKLFVQLLTSFKYINIYLHSETLKEKCNFQILKELSSGRKDATFPKHLV